MLIGVTTLSYKERNTSYDDILQTLPIHFAEELYGYIPVQVKATQLLYIR